MSQDYKDILKLLYNEFGDDLIDAGKNVVSDILQEKKTSSNSDDGVDKDEHPFLKKDEIENDNPENDKDIELAEVVDYYDADSFEKHTISEIKESAREVSTSIDVTEAVKDLILMAGEVRKFEEAQITVRKDISANRDVALAKIEVQKAALMTYLEKSFDERKENFQSLFSVVDDALEKDNMQQLALSLESIVKLADSSPFKDLKNIEATANALSDPSHEWDF